MFTQQLLTEELERRIARRTGEDAAVGVIVVLRNFDPASFAEASMRFASGVREPERWLTSFTRTVFLAGNPAALADRFDFAHVAPDGSSAWLGPVPENAAVPLRRLLRLFDGRVQVAPPPVIEVPGRGTPHRLQVSTSGVTVANYLVHVNHLVAESVLIGAIAPGDALRISHVPRLERLPYRALRVHRDVHDPSTLRAYASLL